MEREQAIPDDGLRVERPPEPSAKPLQDADPKLYQAVQDTLGALREDMLPTDLQAELFNAMSPGTQRDLVAKSSGLDSSILMTFKNHLTLIEAILRRTFNDDGTLKGGGEDLGMEPKDALNMSMRINQMMIKELPKIYEMERIQRMEAALYEIMKRHFTREQQTEFLEELENQSR